ncbi:MAG: hypothetical protein JXL80_07560, partial [Planctomycetes bacterium]|nr:hypothetical protein [Planctomycetota bacterium]
MVEVPRVSTWQTTTNSSGYFSYRPEGLVPGQVTIRARARELDSVTKQWVVGDWEPFTLTYDRANQPPEIVAVELELATDFADSGGAGPWSTDPTLQGRVTNDGPVDAIMVEFDLDIANNDNVDFDDVVDGTAITDADGRFFLSPAGLEPGSITVRVRAKEYGENGAALYSHADWATCPSYTFELRPWSYEVTTLELDTDPGGSSDPDDDGVTTSPLIQGSVSGPVADLSGITIELDVDGDGEADGNVQSGGDSGGFSYTPDPADLEEGLVTVGVRVVADQDGWPQYGSWTSVAFVYYQDDGAEDPFGLTEALALAADLAVDDPADPDDPGDPNWRDPDATYTAASYAVQTTYRTDLAAHTLAYDTTVADATWLRNTQVQTATDTYNSLVATAEAAYTAAVTQAGSDFQDALQQLPAEQRTSYHVQEFAWAAAPYDNAPTLPDPSTQPLPPGAAPAYDGFSFDFTSDPYHREAMAMAAASYTATIRQSDTALAAARQEAKAALDAALAAAQATYGQKQAEIRQQYETDIQAGTPPYDLTVARAAYRDAVQAAYNAYMAVYAVQYGLLQNADVTASTQRACLEALATALNARDKAISSAEEDFANRQAAVIRWQQQRQIEAEQDRDLALAQAERDRAMAEAAARRIHAETLAGATETRAQQAADAQEQRWQDEIDSKESRVDAFASATENLGEQGSSSEAARAEYQSDVVDHQQTYWGNVISAHSTYADAVAAALRTEAEAVAAAAEKHAQEAADAQYDRTTARAEATCDRELAEITAEWDLADENAQHRRTQQDAFADAQRDYDFDEAQRMETDTLKRLALATRWLAITQMEEGHAKNVAQRDFCIDEFTHDRTDVAQREQNEKNLQTARNNAAKAYRDDCLASEETWFGTIADAAAAYEIALAQIDRGYTVAVVASAGDRDNAIAAAAATRVQQVAGLEKQYLHDKAQQQVGRDNNEASAYHGYVSDLADDYLQEVTAWSDGSPWGVYQVALVTASKDRAVSLALSHVTYTSDVGIASTAWNDSVTTADETFTNAVAGADKARTADFVHALKRHTSRVAAARVVHAVTAANLTSQHDKDVAAKDRAYREGESVGGVVTGGVFNLDTSRLNDMAEAEREYEAGVQPEDPTFGDIEVYWIRYRRDEEEITPSEANEQTATHWVQVEEYNEQLRQTWHQEQADIYQQWANDQAADRQQWTNEVGQLNVDWTGAIAAADSALAAEIRRQDVQLANDRAGAAVAYAQAVAAASKAQTLGWAAADQTLTTSVAAADAADAVRWTAAENAAREQVAGAFGTYELALYTNHATALQSTGDPLADYIDEVADAYIAWAQAVKADRDTYHDDLTLANEALTAGLNSANTNHTSSVATANSQYTGGLAEAGRGWSIDSAKASAYLDRDSRAADANLVEARVNAQGAYDFARAVADRGLDDAKAAADVAWTAAVADQYAWLHLHPDADWPYGYPLPSAIVDANIAVADAAREALHDTAAYPHATKIRDAQIANAVRVGNAEVLRAAALGAVETTYVGRVNAAELDFANGVKAAEDVRAPLVANANILHANTTATVYEGYTNQLGGADVTYQGDLGDAYVTLAGTVAGHQADYHIALATAARDQHTQGTFPWDHADARLSWLTSLKPDYEAFVEDSAGSDADYDDGVAGAVAQWLDRLAHADVLYTDVAAPVDANYVRDVVQEGPAYQVDVVGRENSRRASLAAADQTQHADDAAARRTELVARITAQAEYEVDRVRITPVLGGVPLEEHPYMIAAAATRDATLDQAALALATQRADIDQVWTNGVAAANRDFIEGNAQDGKQLADGLASLEKSYRETLAGHVAAWKNDYADATAGSYSQQEGFGYLKALMVAENQWQADASAASAEWLQAGYDQTAAQWAGLAADYPTLPWAGFQADLSDTLANWWWDPQAGPEGEGFKQDYLEWVENTNASWDGYQDAANAAYVTQTAELAGSAQRLICGWTTGITGLAAADQTRANAVAQAYADYVGLPGGAHGMADAMEDYAQGVAQIHRDDAVAQKIEQLEGTPAPEIEPALAVEAAAYRGDAAALTIVGRNAVAAAALDYANTVYAAGGPFVTFHQESHAAVKTFLDAETDAFADTRIAIAGWDTT